MKKIYYFFRYVFRISHGYKNKIYRIDIKTAWNISKIITQS